MLFSNTKAHFKNKLNYLLGCFSALLLLSSCEDPNELGLGLVEDNIQGKFIDTLSIDVSTVLLDSIATSGTGGLLVGQYTDPNAGTLKASTFFQLGLGSTWTLAADATYDSLRLVLNTSSNYYGDTTKAITFTANEVTSALAARTLSPVFPNEQPRSLFYSASALYNTSKVLVAPTALTTFSFLPRPVRKDTLLVPLSDELGRQWFALRKAGDTKLTDNTSFQSYFKGLSLAPLEGSAVASFPAASTVVRLYYSETVSGAKVSKVHDFPIVNSSLQFNKFENDFTGSPLAGIVRGEELPAAAANGVGVAQAGSGLMIKIEIPYLNRLKEQLKAEFVNHAVLIVEPLQGATTTNPYPVPSVLNLYRTNENNVPYATVNANYTAGSNVPPLAAGFNKDAGTNGRYEFIITQYIVDKLKDERLGSDNALFIAPASSAYQSSVGRLVVGAQRIKLKVYYTTIK
ncbi:DUF4270 family protein [Pontibacter rugosus]|uniref:DUF4270 family protein n=1 Tax=Pontibacter rugosus TaxID=1745966 RepID=A0ABW3STI3_9BACT